MNPKQAGRRLILLTLPFLALGLIFALWPPVTERLGPAGPLARALGIALTLLAVGAIGMGIYLLRRPDEKIL